MGSPHRTREWGHQRWLERQNNKDRSVVASSQDSRTCVDFTAEPLLNPPHKFKDWVLPVLPAFLFAVTKCLM